MVAVGGDGTANKVLNGLMQSKRVGESARGTCNGYRVRRPTITQPSLVISIMNGQRMGGGFFMAPDGKPDDGMLDLCIAREVSRARIFGLVLHFMRGTQATQEPIKMGQAREIVVTAIKGALPAHADGETLCTDGQRLEMELLPGQIEIIYQPPEAI